MGFQKRAEQPDEVLEEDPGAKAVAGLGHVDPIGKQIRIVRHGYRNILKPDSARGGVVAEEPVLEIGQPADVGQPARGPTNWRSPSG